MMQFERLIAIRLVSHDAAALAEFYTAALGFEHATTTPIAANELAMLGLTGTGSRLTMALGGQRLEIDQFDPPGRPYPEPCASNDRLFQHFAMITPDMSSAWARVLAAGGAPVSHDGPAQLPPENGSVRAVKFRDPEGHPLELLALPDPKPASPALVIDHSAIVVRNVAASIAFYEEHGLAIGNRTLNQGPAQAALDGLIEPRVDVVSLHPPGSGPHLELLGYRHPVARPDSPWNLRDVAATRLVWQASHVMLVIDPDGHVHQCQPPCMPPAFPSTIG